MSRDDADADYVAAEDDEVVAEYPYPWDNDPDSLEPKTPLHRPNPHDPMEPRRRRDRFRGRVADDGSFTVPGQTKGLTLPGQIKGSCQESQESQESQETQDDHPLRISRRELPPDSVHSDDLPECPRLSQSDLPRRTTTTTPRHDRRFPVAKDTPLTLRQTANRHAMVPNRAEDKHFRNADEGMKVLIGPMPVEEFLNEFLPPVDETEMPDPTGAFDGVPERAKHEEEIYPLLIAAINENGRCPGLTFVNTSVTSEQKRRGVFKPDVTVYNEEDVSLLKRVPSKVGDVLHTCANLGIAESCFEVKPDDESDPFFDESEEKGKHFFDWKNYTKDGSSYKKKKKAFGQAVSYASESCARQHRVFYHSVLIVGTGARFFRWDRAGIVVTRKFDYQQNPKLLCRYLWRLSGANTIERGFDPTITIASAAETAVFEEVVTEEVAFQKGIDRSDKAMLEEALKVHFENKKVTKAIVYGDSESQTEEYLVSVPVHSPLSCAGHSSRGYWSTKVVRNQDGSIGGEVGFLKDVWRNDFPSGTTEGDVLSEMAGIVPNIPRVDCFGDVPDDDYSKMEVTNGGGQHVSGTTGKAQTTRTQDFIFKEWVNKSCRILPEKSVDDLHRRVVKHVHYRMASKTVGYPLSDFTDAIELFLALKDVLRALIIAYKKMKILHRDVSMDNIILCRSKKDNRRMGVLIDWEFSVLADREGRASDYYRSGTWAFMSTNVLLRDLDFRHSHQDDLESLFYVALYFAVHRLPHNQKMALGGWMHNFFDQAIMQEDGSTIGGHVKLSYKYYPAKFSTEFIFENEHINAWFAKSYPDLSTYSNLVKIEDSKWTSKNVWRHMCVLCEALSEGKQQGVTKVEHSVADKFIPEECNYWATHISVSNVGSGARLSTISQPQSGPGSKRSRTEFEERSSEPQPENKRSRLSLKDIQTKYLPLRLDPDGNSGNGVGVEQDHERKIPDELLQLLLEEDLPRRSGLPSDDDDDDLYVAEPDML
ncbi:hypothetical protein ACEPAI_8692 [Sanghuangporus weigelae]